MRGIYIITSPSGKRYVGKSEDVPCRLKRHKRSVTARRVSRNGSTGTALPITKAIAKYGWDAMKMAILPVPDGDLSSIERDFIWLYRSNEAATGYNLTDGGEGVVGWRSTPESRAKLSAAKQGKKQSPEAIAHRAAQLKGRKRSPETIEKVRLANIGQKRTVEQRARIGLLSRGRILTEEQKAQKRAYRHTNEARARISQAMSGRTLSPQTIAKLTGRKKSPETREKMSVARRATVVLKRALSEQQLRML